MSFDNQILRNRLATSTEAVDSITSTALWILFHKQHAATIAQQWATALATDDNKLAEIYVANEVIQKSKLKRKGEFVDEFAAVLPSALNGAYNKSDSTTRDRIFRVVQVWRDRNILNPADQDAVEEALLSTTSTSAPPTTSTAIPADLTQLVRLYTKIATAASTGDGPGCAQLAPAAIRALDDVRSKINSMVESTNQKNTADEIEVYTAIDAVQNIADDNNDDDEIGYADEEEEEDKEDKDMGAPPEKKQKVDVDPKLASFLASMSNNS